MMIKVETRGHNRQDEGRNVAYETLQEAIEAKHITSPEQIDSIKKGEVISYSDNNFSYWFSKAK